MTEQNQTNRACRIFGSRGWGDFRIGADFILPSEERVMRMVCKDINMSLTRLRTWNHRPLNSFLLKETSTDVNVFGVGNYPHKFVDHTKPLFFYHSIPEKFIIDLPRLMAVHKHIPNGRFIELYNLLYKWDIDRTNGIGFFSYAHRYGIPIHTSCLILIQYIIFLQDEHKVKSLMDVFLGSNQGNNLNNILENVLYKIPNYAPAIEYERRQFP